MSRALVLVWIGTAAARPEHEADLDSWARSRIVTLVSPADPQASAPYDEALASRFEGLLAEGQTAVEADDRETARKRLDVAGRLLLEHPELPQAAWFRSELLRVDAALAEKTDVGKAAELLTQAEALDGRRAAVYRSETERKAPAPPNAASPPEPVTVLPRVPVAGLRPSDWVFVDGARVDPPEVPASGEHHIRILRNGHPVVARWMTVPSGASRFVVEMDPIGECSALDLDDLSPSGSVLTVPKGITCPDWVVARPAADGGIEVARCRGSVCGPLLAWKASNGAIYTGAPQPAVERGGFPAWLGWTLAGAALVATGGVVAWQAGAFDEPRPKDPGFSWTGPDATSAPPPR